MINGHLGFVRLREVNGERVIKGIINNNPIMLHGDTRSSSEITGKTRNVKALLFYIDYIQDVQRLSKNGYR